MPRFRFEGFLADVIAILSRRVGFEYDLQLTVEGHGQEGENNTWTGMIGMVQRGVKYLPLPFHPPPTPSNERSTYPQRARYLQDLRDGHAWAAISRSAEAFG